MQAAEAVAGEPEAPEGQHVGRHGEPAHEREHQHHVDPPRQLSQSARALDEDLALVGEAGEALGEEADGCRSGGEPGRRQGCVADPRRIEPQQHLLLGDRRHLEVGAELADVDGRAGRGGQAGDLGVGPVQQLGPQPSTLVDEQGVEHQAVARAAAGRDLDLGQPEQPVVQLGGEVDGAHLVEPCRRRLLGEQAPLQLDLPLDDAIARRQPPHHSEGDDERQRDQLPPAVAVRARDEDDDEGGKQPHQGLDRVDEQHPGVEPAPRRHVASPRSRMATAVVTPRAAGPPGGRGRGCSAGPPPTQ